MRKVKLEEKKIGKQATALPEKSSPLPKEQDSGVSHPDKEKPTRPPLTAAKHSPTHPLLEGSKEAEKKEVPPTQGRHKFPSEISRPPSTTKEEK